MLEKELENITTLALLVGRFDKMQAYDIKGSDGSIFEFEVRNWREDSEFRMSVESLLEEYPIARTYVHSMTKIIERQNQYRRENELTLPIDFLAEKRRE